MLFYLVLGALAGIMNELGSKERLIWFALFAGATTLIFVGSSMEYAAYGRIIGNFYSYQHPAVIIASLGAFQLLRSGRLKDSIF